MIIKEPTNLTDLVDELEAVYKTEGERPANKKLCNMVLYFVLSERDTKNVILEFRKRIGKESL